MDSVLLVGTAVLTYTLDRLNEELGGGREAQIQRINCSSYGGWCTVDPTDIILSIIKGKKTMKIS